MPKPDPALLDPARYPHSCRVEPRFGDLDINLHVTNVGLIELAQEGRVRFYQASAYRDSMGSASTMVASFAIEFLGEAFYPEPLDVHTALASIGRTSQTIEQLLTQGGRIVAWTRAVIVQVKDGKPSELSQAFRRSAEDWMLRT